MKKKPLVSVIVPVYNVEKYLDECLKSITNQSYQNIEILLINDGSTDNSSKICKQYQKSDDRVRLIEQDNGGLSSARNTGIRAASGKFFVFVDSDDTVKCEYVEKLLRAAIDNNSDIAVCGFNDSIPNEKTLRGDEATTKLLIEQENLDILTWNKIYKKELFVDEGIEFPEGKIHEDNLTTYKLYSKSKYVSYINEALYNYRIRPNSITSSEKRTDRLRIREESARQAIAYLKDDKNLYNAAKTSLLLAKLAYIDNGINGTIDKKYISSNIEWLNKESANYLNETATKKLRVYLKLIRHFNGMPYILFRKIIHE